MREYPVSVSVFYGEDGPNVHVTRWRPGEERPQARTYRRPGKPRLVRRRTRRGAALIRLRRRGAAENPRKGALERWTTG